MEQRTSQYAINGFFFSQQLTGVQRVAREVVLALDEICKPGEFVLVMPKSVSQVPVLKRIATERCGAGGLLYWEQVCFSSYLAKTKRKAVNLCQTAPLLHTGLFSMYDCAYETHPEFFDGLHGGASKLYHRLLFRIAARGSHPLLSDSNAAKDEICSVYGLPKSRVTVAGCGWEHIERVAVRGTETKDMGLEPGTFFFSLGGGKNKNIEWVYEVAKRNPRTLFVVAGKKAASNRSTYRDCENVRLLGYVNDSQMKALMQDCKAFLFPSTYEGFGLPPLEALACGSKIIVSDIPVFREIYGSAAAYVDPFRFDYDMDEIATTKVGGPTEVLNANTWAKSAEKFLRLVRNLENEKSRNDG